MQRLVGYLFDGITNTTDVEAAVRLVASKYDATVVAVAVGRNVIYSGTLTIVPNQYTLPNHVLCLVGEN